MSELRKNSLLLSIESWLVYRDPYVSLLKSPYNWVVCHPLYNLNNQGPFFSLLKRSYDAYNLMVMTPTLWRFRRSFPSPFLFSEFPQVTGEYTLQKGETGEKLEKKILQKGHA